MIKPLKLKVLVLLSLSAVLLAILALSLPQLKVLPPENVAILAKNPPVSLDQSTVHIDWLSLLMRGVVALLLILVPVYILYSLFTKAGRRRLVRDLLLLAAIILIGSFLSGNPLNSPIVTQIPPTEQGDLVTPLPPIAGEPHTMLPNFEAHLQPWLVVLMVVGVAAIVTGAVLLMLRGLIVADEQSRNPFEELAEDAMEALAGLDSGQDFKDVVIRCYAQMSQALRSERGITRNQAMTPKEFEQQLLSFGLPAGPVDRLTRLFEQARYSPLPIDSAEQAEAVSSLNAILDYCRGQA